MRTTQYERVLRHLADFGKISQLSAFREYGIMRLGAVIFQLRKDGYDIKTTFRTSKNRYGEPTTYAVYVYKKGE